MSENDVNVNEQEQEFDGGVPWEETQAPAPTPGGAVPSMFAGVDTTAEVGSASESTEDVTISVDYPKPEYVVISKQGFFAINQPAPKNSGKKIEQAPLLDKKGNGCRAIRIQLGNGDALQEDCGWFRKSVIWLTEEEQKIVQKALTGIFPGTVVDRSVSSYGSCKGGISEPGMNGLNTIVWDRLIYGLYQRSPELRQYWENTNVAWDKNRNGDDKMLPVFKDPAGRRLLNSGYYLELKSIFAIPIDVKVPAVSEEKDAHVMRTTDWSGKALAMFEKAVAVAFSEFKQVDVATVYGQLRSEFENYMYSLFIDVTTLSVPSKKYGNFIHPRFFAPIKNGLKKGSKALFEGLGMSIYEAIQTPKFAQLMTGRPMPFTTEQVEENWLGIAGNIAVVIDSNNKPDILLVDPASADDSRKHV